jgi:hypothetical protein
MDQIYNQYKERARHFERHVNDLVNHDDPQGRLLHNQFRLLLEEIEEGKDHPHLENRMHTIDRQLDQALRSNYISNSHAAELQHNMRDWRNEIRNHHS